MDTSTNRSPAAVATPQPNGQDHTPETELNYRLKGAIDGRGRYSFRLNDMAAGFAAGRNVSPPLARQTIEGSFARQFGMSPQEYLDRHYDQRRELGHDVAPQRTRNRGPERGR